MYKKILLKLSGEALNGSTHNLYNLETINNIILQIKELVKIKIKLGIVIGGGNIFRGKEGKHLSIQTINANYMGILATIINGIALKDLLNNQNIKSRICSAIPFSHVIKSYNKDEINLILKNNEVIIFTAGTGQPFFSTDTAAALKAIEMEAQLLIKATKVNGVYDEDPLINPNAKKYEQISYDEAISKKLNIMDLSAFEICRENKINIQVCNVFENDSLIRSVLGENIGTLIHY